MQGEVTISIDPKVLEKLDKLRGDIPREVFLEKLLSEVSKEGDKPVEDTAGESRLEGDDASTSTDKVDNIISDKLETILSKMTEVEELNARIKELESKQSELESSIRKTETVVKVATEEGAPDTDPKPDEPAHFTVTETGENGEADDEGEGDFEINEDDIEFEIDEGEVETESEEVTDAFEFIFGCSRCKSSVAETDTTCPSCGEVLEELPASTDWLERVGQRHEDQYPDTGWEGDFYDDEQGGSYADDYDPSPDAESKNYLDYRRQTAERGHRASTPHPVNDRRPFCENCGGETDYISRYDRWYCNRCSLYVPSPNVITETERESFRSDKSHVLERVLSRREAEAKSRSASGDKPLTNYGPYAASGSITRISMVDTDSRSTKRKRQR